MNDKGVYRTALSLLGLLNTVDWVGRLRLKQTNCQMKKASQQRQSTSAFGSQCPSNIWGIARGMRGLLPGHCNPGATQECSGG